MGLRPTTKKVNGRWYDINQAADRIAQLEQQLAEKQKAYDELDMMFIAMRDVKRDFEQQVEAQRAMLERIIDQCKPIFQMRGSVMIATYVLDEARKVLATAQQEE